MGGDGIDRAQYHQSSEALLVDLQFAHLNTGEAIGDTFDSIEGLYGSTHDDDLRGDDVANQLWGHDGDDRLHGRDEDDVLFGGNGDDLLYGGNGADTLDGGPGTDRAMYYSADGSFLADLGYAHLNTGVAAGDIYVSIENLHGGGGNDSLRGDADDNKIWGGDGNDQLHGRSGNDILIGGAGEHLRKRCADPTFLTAA